MQTFWGRSAVGTVCLLGLILGAIPAAAQFETAEVLGTVHDPTGAILAKASIVLTNEETSIESKTVSDDSGNYDFFNVKPGRYTITAELTGFQTFRRLTFEWT